MARLTTRQRKRIPRSEYGLPEKAKKGPRGGAPRGAYPIPDKRRARSAKAYASKEYNKGNLSTSEKAKIDAKANKKLGKGKKKSKSKSKSKKR